MSKILRNDTVSDIVIDDTGVTIQPGVGNQYTIPPVDYLLWAESSDVITKIGAGNLVVNDGSSDLSISDGTDLIKGIFPKTIGTLSGDDFTEIGHVSDYLKVVTPDDDVNGRRRVYFWAPLLNGGSPDMDVNGTSGSPIEFTSGPGAGEVWYLEQLSFLIHHPGSMDSTDYGSIAGGLTNGFQVVFDLNSTETTFVNLKNNVEITNTMSGITGSTGDESFGWLDDDDWFSGHIDFNTPIKFIGDDGDQIIGRVRDSLSILQEQQMCALFWKEI